MSSDVKPRATEARTTRGPSTPTPATLANGGQPGAITQRGGPTVSGAEGGTFIGRTPGSRFVAVPNEVVRDRRVSFGARAMLTMMCSYRSGTPWNAERCAELSDHDGRDQCRAFMRQLMTVGYARRRRVRRDNGTFATYLDLTWNPGDFGDEEPVDNELTGAGQAARGATSTDTTNAQVAPRAASPHAVRPASIEDVDPKTFLKTHTAPAAVVDGAAGATAARPSAWEPHPFEPRADGLSCWCGKWGDDELHERETRTAFPTNRSADRAACSLCADSGWLTNDYGHAVQCTHPAFAQRLSTPAEARDRLRALRGPA